LARFLGTFLAAFAAGSLPVGACPWVLEGGIEMIATRRGLLGTIAGSAVTLAGLGAAGPAEAASLEDIKTRGYMTVATEDDYQPFEYIKDGTPTGYDQDLLEAMKPTLPFKVRQDIIPWTGILPGVTTGKYDIAVTAILVTAARMQVLDFCSPVAASVDYYLKRKSDGSITSIKDLSGKPLGVEAGSAMLKMLPQLEEMLKQTGGALGKVVQYQGYPEAYQDLALGRVDYVVNTLLSLQSVAAARPNVFAVGQAVSKPVYIAWAVQKGNTGLRDLINAELAAAKKNGSMESLQQKYFGMTFKDLPTHPIANV
jgi:polar amino acid transport system substrate-binding protein